MKCLAKQSFLWFASYQFFYNMGNRNSDIPQTSPVKEVKVYTNDKQQLMAKQKLLIFLKIMWIWFEMFLKIRRIFVLIRMIF